MSHGHGRRRHSPPAPARQPRHLKIFIEQKNTPSKLCNSLHFSHTCMVFRTLTAEPHPLKKIHRMKEYTVERSIPPRSSFLPHNYLLDIASLPLFSPFSLAADLSQAFSLSTLTPFLPPFTPLLPLPPTSDKLFHRRSRLACPTMGVRRGTISGPRPQLKPAPAPLRPCASTDRHTLAPKRPRRPTVRAL